jgi:N-acetylglutamate synthase/N-acetylornithine aminotransferase
MSGTKNKMDDLRNHLFETLEALKDPEKPMDLDRAKAVADVAKEIIASAKVEVDFLRVTGAAEGSGFITTARPESKGISAGGSDVVRPRALPGVKGAR